MRNKPPTFLALLAEDIETAARADREALARMIRETEQALGMLGPDSTESKPRRLWRDRIPEED